MLGDSAPLRSRVPRAAGERWTRDVEGRRCLVGVLFALEVDDDHDDDDHDPVELVEPFRQFVVSQPRDRGCRRGRLPAQRIATVPGGVQIRILGYVLDHAGTRILRTSLGTPQRRVAGLGAYGHGADER